MIEVIMSLPMFVGFGLDTDYNLKAYIVGPDDPTAAPSIDGSSILDGGTLIPILSSFRTARKTAFSVTADSHILLKVS